MDGSNITWNNLYLYNTSEKICPLPIFAEIFWNKFAISMLYFSQVIVKYWSLKLKMFVLVI